MNRCLLIITAAGAMVLEADASNILVSDFSGSGVTFRERPIRSADGSALNATLAPRGITVAQVGLGSFSGFDGSNDGDLSAAPASEDPTVHSGVVSGFIASGGNFVDDPNLGAMAAMADVFTLNTMLSPEGVTGAQVRMGYFSGFDGSNDGELAAALASDDPTVLSGALSRFIPMGENFGGNTNLGTVTATGLPRITARTINSVSYQGRLAGQVSNAVVTTGAPNSVSPSGVPSGTRIFLLVYNTSAATATELGIFSSTAWIMPADNLTNPTLNTVDVDEVAEVFRGSFNGSELRLAVIPEPSAALLAFVGAGFILLRRRR